MQTIKRLVFQKMFDFLIGFVDQNWNELISEGKEYTLDILRTWQASILGDSMPMRGGNPDDHPGQALFGTFCEQVEGTRIQAEREAE